MGFTPRQVDEMSLWEFAACAEGYRRAHSAEEERLPPPTADEFRAMVDAHAHRRAGRLN